MLDVMWAGHKTYVIQVDIYCNPYCKPLRFNVNLQGTIVYKFIRISISAYKDVFKCIIL